MCASPEPIIAQSARVVAMRLGGKPSNEFHGHANRTAPAARYFFSPFIAAPEHAEGHPRYNYSITKFEDQERQTIGAFKEEAGLGNASQKERQAERREAFRHWRGASGMPADPTGRHPIDSGRRDLRGDSAPGAVR